MSEPINKHSKIAICLRGAVSKIERHFYNQNELYLPGKYINFIAVYNSIQKHIIDANPDYIFDFFIHCWNQDLKKDLVHLYNPKQYFFEDNTKYNQEISSKINSPELFTGASTSLSIKKSIELFEDYSNKSNIKYNTVIIYRPDVILLKDIILSTYDRNNIYVNNVNKLNKQAGMKAGHGDFHFIMNPELASLFKKLYDHISLGNPVKHHFWIQNYINNFMKKELMEDDIEAGFHQEVLRKINPVMIQNNRISIEQLLSYGLTREEISTYNVH